MKKLTLALLVLFPFFGLLGQSKQDYIWLFGYDSWAATENPIFGGSVIDFNQDPPATFIDLRDMNINATLASICDTAGNLLLYSNGIYIANAQHDTIANSEGLNPGGTLGFDSYGMRLPQGALLLPLPESESEFVLLHEGYKVIANPPPLPGIDLACGPFYETRIDMSLNGGAGGVIYKNYIILDDTLDAGKLVATRHANGRDWWVVLPEYDSPRIYRFLLSPGGIQILPPQILEDTLWNGLGQAVFSPDGSKYVHLSLYDWGNNFLTIFDFDRCSGIFSSIGQINYAETDAHGGVAISPNSRYLYLCAQQEVYQFDMWANDIEASRGTVAVYDGYFEPIPGFNDSVAMTFFFAQLTPNGKIVIGQGSTVRSLHVINQPDLPGEACEVLQHAIMTPTLKGPALPNYPNFRLGPLPGSGCDTLGPLAAFSHVPAGLAVDFNDESLKNPTSWHWDFGDGQGSQEQYPQHQYETEGAYDVCLEVRNAYGADTLCKTITVTTVGTSYAGADAGVRLYPNPSRSEATLALPGSSGAVYDFVLQSADGRIVLQKSGLTPGNHLLSLSHLPAAVYLANVLLDGRQVWIEKFVIVM
ncbi:MAG: PKD domain-containing protein [Saprospiraceae bacterium]|nr:PKD domain-containing protein [Saprospiraceae bacterium]